MPTLYGPRKTNRRQWSQMDLDRAIKAIRVDKLSIRQAARENHIPEKILHIQLDTGKYTEENLNKYSHLGTEAEAKLVAHIQKLQSLGFSPTRHTLRHLAYNLSQLMGLEGPFNKKKRSAGNYWCALFLKRNPTLHVTKANNFVSIARNQCMDKRVVKEFFELLTRTFTENELLNKPGNIFTMDESCLQLQGKTITVVACCNAEGNFIPPYCIVQGADNEFLKECMPPGSVVKLNSESADCSTELFMDWFVNHFVVWKPVGKCVLILDDYESHMNSLDMLEIAVRHDVILQCLPHLTSHYLQPLNRSFFTPLKLAYSNACKEFIKNQKSVKMIDFRNLGLLFSSAWVSTANAESAIAGFSCSGIWPLQPLAIPESAYLVTSQSTGSIITETVDAEASTTSLARISSDDLIDESNFNENKCIECLNTCEKTVTANWIQCVGCLRWLHDICTIYSDKCAFCGQIPNKQSAKELIETQSASFDGQQEANVMEADNDLLYIKEEEITIEEMNLENVLRSIPKEESVSDDDCKFDQEESHTNQHAVPHTLGDKTMDICKFHNNKRKLSEKENIAGEDQNFRNNVPVKIENEDDYLDYDFHVVSRLQNSNQSERAIKIAKQKIDEILCDLERGAFENSY